MKILIALFCWLCPCLLFGDAPAIPSLEHQPDAQELRVKMWYLPVTKMTGTARDLLPEEVPETQAPVDGRRWFEDNGIQFGPGEEVLFDGRLRVLMVRAKGATIEKIGQVVHHQWPDNPVEFLRIEVDLAEFSAGKPLQINSETSYETVLKEAGDSWRVLSRLQVVTRSGQKATAVSNAPSAPLRRGEPEVAVEIEPILSPDEKIIDLNLSYRFRAGKNPPLDRKTVTSAVVKDGSPVIVQVNSVAPEGDRAAPMKFRGLVIKVDVVRVKSVSGPAFPQPGTVR